MSIKLTILKTGETLIADIKELVSDEKVCGYLLKSPQIVSIKKELVLVEQSEEKNVNRGEVQVSLTPWIILTKEKEIPILDLSYVVTLVEPIESVKKMYEEKVNVEDG
jgi:hypothetical protein